MSIGGKVFQKISISHLRVKAQLISDIEHFWSEHKLRSNRVPKIQKQLRIIVLFPLQIGNIFILEEKCLDNHGCCTRIPLTLLYANLHQIYANWNSWATPGRQRQLSGWWMCCRIVFPLSCIIFVHSLPNQNRPDFLARQVRICSKRQGVNSGKSAQRADNAQLSGLSSPSSSSFSSTDPSWPRLWLWPCRWWQWQWLEVRSGEAQVAALLAGHNEAQTTLLSSNGKSSPVGCGRILK